MKTSLTIEITVAKLTGRSCVAVTRLGGMTVRGNRAENALDAVQSLFFKLSQSGTHRDGDDEAAIAIELALEDVTIEDIVSGARPALGDGGEEDTASEE